MGAWREATILRIHRLAPRILARGRIKCECGIRLSATVDAVEEGRSDGEGGAGRSGADTVGYAAGGEERWDGWYGRRVLARVGDGAAGSFDFYDGRFASSNDVGLRDDGVAAVDGGGDRGPVVGAADGVAEEVFGAELDVARSREIRTARGVREGHGRYRRNEVGWRPRL